MLNEEGQVFDDETIESQSGLFDRFDEAERIDYRDRNAAAISTSSIRQTLIVAGPGTGKSFLFLDRIADWLERFPGERIFVCSFVRKLVADLTRDIETSSLSPAEKGLVTVTTLHGLARSIIERSGGTKEQRLEPFVQVVTQEWKGAVWGDVLSLTPEAAPQDFDALERQFHEFALDNHDPWPQLRDSYGRICRFYNAIGFADSIVYAIEALRENPELIEHSLWIVDEYQDFNASEAQLLAACTARAQAILLAGDDDQALYQDLKSSHPEIIRAKYRDDRTYAKAMLPLSGRSSFHICMGASAFLDQRRDPDSIRKIFLPVSTDDTVERIQIVAGSSQTVAVNYIVEFIEAHREALEARREAILAGDSKDPYVLVLSYQRDVAAYYGDQGVRLLEVLSEWKLETETYGPDYARLLTYRTLARHPEANFAARKVLAYESFAEAHIHELVRSALSQSLAITQLHDEPVTRALEVANQVRELLESDSNPGDVANAIAAITWVQNSDRLAADLASYPIGAPAASNHEEEEIETPVTVSPAEFMTMVGAKGLSADHVFLVGVDNVNMNPVSTSMFFVAMTRARQSLHLLTALRARGASFPHEFVGDIPEEHCDYSKLTKGEGVRMADRAELMHWFEAIARARRRSRERAP
jgi:superfamily I DNA/RNA helicase